MITDEINVPVFIEYLESKGILTKVYGPNDKVSTIYLYSVDKETETIFLTKLVLDEGNHQLSYEIKTQNVVNVYIYDNFFRSEAIDSLLDS